jgi:Membrane-associating domain
MTFDSHIRRGHPIICSLLALFGIVELAISAWLTARFNRFQDYSDISERDRVRFTLFASTWTVSTSIFLGLMFTLHSASSALTNTLVHIIWLFLTWVIWTAAAAAVTEMLGGGLNCNDVTGFNYCGQLNALEAFAWLEW